MSVPQTSPLVLLAATCSSIGKSDKGLSDDYLIKFQKSMLSNNNIAKLNNNLTTSNNYQSTFKPKMKNTISATFKPYNTTNTAFKSYDIGTKICDKETFPRQYFSPAAVNSSSSIFSTSPEKKEFLINNDCWSENSPPFLNKKFIENFNYVNNRPRSDPLPITEPKLTSACLCSICVEKDKDSFFPYKLATSPVCRDPDCMKCFKPETVHRTALMNQTLDQLSPKSQFGTNKQYTCNWVSESKQCGSCFATSEELFKHLKTHTNLQQHQRTASEIKTQSQALNKCNNYECACKLNTLTTNRAHSYDEYAGNSTLNWYSHKFRSDGLSAFKPPAYVSRR